MENYIGKVIDNRYEVLSLIGVGGMANVYKALDKQTGAEVAVKFLKEEFFENEELVRRFKNESKAISLLNHESIIKVLDFNITNEEKYLVVEYIEGVTLKEFIENRGKLTWEETILFANIILNALEHAHNHGVVHRDLKPQNIMLTRDGQLKIMDFGIARLATANQRTVTDKAIGSVHYISPEQVRGENTDNRADIYSVGIMMYEMLTGKLPFQSGTAVSVALQQLSDKAQPISELVSDVPKGLEQIVMKAIEKDPDNRYPTANDMRKDLLAVKENPEIMFGLNTEQPDEQTKTVMVDTVAKKKSKVKVKKGKVNLLAVMAGLAVAFALSSAVAVYMIFSMSGNALLSNKADVVMPDFVGMTEKEAKNSGNSFKYEVEYQYNDQYEKNVIFAQTPKASKTVKENSTVTLKVSKGIMTSEMPDLANYTRAEAQKVLEDLGVNVSVKSEKTKKVPEGNVVRTDPEAGTVVTSGSLVTLYIAINAEKTTSVVPNVVGSADLATAKRALTGAKFRVGSFTQAESFEPVGTVIAQSPEAGTELPVGSAITLVISGGPPTCPECGSTEHTVHPAPPPPPPKEPEDEDDDKEESVKPEEKPNPTSPTVPDSKPEEVKPPQPENPTNQNETQKPANP